MSLDTAKLNGAAGGYRTVFDVGAFRGDFAAACLAAWPACRVECFEPLEPAPPLLSDRAGWHPVALGPRHILAPMWECEFVPSSSMLQMAATHKQAFPYTSSNRPVQVEQHTLVEYRDLIVPPALLKLDVQGYELEVLRGAGEALDWFSAVVAEVSWQELYAGAPAYEQLEDFLAGAGFGHAWRVDEMPHPTTGEVLQTDELWLR